MTPAKWRGHYAHRLPEELCGPLAELARSASRAFIELFGCDSAPQRVKGAADMLVQKVPSAEGAYLVIRPGLMRAMAELDLRDPLPSTLEQGVFSRAPDHRSAADGAVDRRPERQPGLVRPIDCRKVSDRRRPAVVPSNTAIG